MDSNFRHRIKSTDSSAIMPFYPLYLGTKPGTIRPSLNGGREMARPATNLHLQPKNGGWRARILVPVELQGRIGKKVFSTPVWKVTKSEAAALAWPEVQKFGALIENARSGKCSSAIEVEAQGPILPQPAFAVRGVNTVRTKTETSFTALIAEWARKKR